MHPYSHPTLCYRIYYLSYSIVEYKQTKTKQAYRGKTYEYHSYVQRDPGSTEKGRADCRRHGSQDDWSSTLWSWNQDAGAGRWRYQWELLRSEGRHPGSTGSGKGSTREPFSHHSRTPGR